MLKIFCPKSDILFTKRRSIYGYTRQRKIPSAATTAERTAASHHTPQYSSWRWCNPDVYRLGLLTYVHQQKQTATSGNVSERFSEAASSAALETASRNDLDTETAAATEKAQKKKKKQSQTTDVSETTPVSADDYLGLLQQQSADLPKLKRILKDPSRYPKSLLKALSKTAKCWILCWIIRKNIKMPLPKASEMTL